MAAETPTKPQQVSTTAAAAAADTSYDMAKKPVPTKKVSAMAAMAATDPHMTAEGRQGSTVATLSQTRPDVASTVATMASDVTNKSADSSEVPAKPVVVERSYVDLLPGHLKRVSTNAPKKTSQGVTNSWSNLSAKKPTDQSSPAKSFSSAAFQQPSAATPVSAAASSRPSQDGSKLSCNPSATKLISQRSLGSSTAAAAATLRQSIAVPVASASSGRPSQDNTNSCSSHSEQKPINQSSNSTARKAINQADDISTPSGKLPACSAKSAASAEKTAGAEALLERSYADMMRNHFRTASLPKVPTQDASKTLANPSAANATNQSSPANRAPAQRDHSTACSKKAAVSDENTAGTTVKSPRHGVNSINDDVKIAASAGLRGTTAAGKNTTAVVRGSAAPVKAALAPVKGPTAGPRVSGKGPMADGKGSTAAVSKATAPVRGAVLPVRGTIAAVKAVGVPSKLTVAPVKNAPAAVKGAKAAAPKKALNKSAVATAAAAAASAALSGSSSTATLSPSATTFRSNSSEEFRSASSDMAELTPFSSPSQASSGSSYTTARSQTSSSGQARRHRHQNGPVRCFTDSSTADSTAAHRRTQASQPPLRPQTGNVEPVRGAEHNPMSNIHSTAGPAVNKQACRPQIRSQTGTVEPIHIARAEHVPVSKVRPPRAESTAPYQASKSQLGPQPGNVEPRQSAKAEHVPVSMQPRAELTANRQAGRPYSRPRTGNAKPRQVPKAERVHVPSLHPIAESAVNRQASKPQISSQTGSAEPMHTAVAERDPMSVVRSRSDSTTYQLASRPQTGSAQPRQIASAECDPMANVHPTADDTASEQPLSSSRQSHSLDETLECALQELLLTADRPDFLLSIQVASAGISYLVLVAFFIQNTFLLLSSNCSDCLLC